MSLCLATVTLTGLLISVDGRGVRQDIDGNVHIVSDDVQKIYQVNDMLIFISGIEQTNMEVIKEIIKSEYQSIDNIPEICREKYMKLKQYGWIQKWENSIKELDSDLVEGSIPICLNVFQFKNNRFTVTKFVPQNNFIPEVIDLKLGQVIANGIYNQEAIKILKNNTSLVRSLENEMKRFELVYRELEKKYKEVGGETFYYLMDLKGIRRININE